MTRRYLFTIGVGLRRASRQAGRPRFGCRAGPLPPFGSSARVACETLLTQELVVVAGEHGLSSTTLPRQVRDEEAGIVPRVPASSPF